MTEARPTEERDEQVRDALAAEIRAYGERQYMAGVQDVALEYLRLEAE